MANHLSALKRARQTTRRTATNRANTSSLRTQLRLLRETIEKGDKAAAEQTYRQTASALDKAIQKGTLHENTASRYKSRLRKRVTAMKYLFSCQLSAISAMLSENSEKIGTDALRRPSFLCDPPYIYIFFVR